MKKLFLSAFFILFSVVPSFIRSVVLADWDPELEAQEEAQRQAARAAEARKQEQARASFRAAEAKMHRQYLGAAAEGKSDEEVSKMYAAKVKSDQENALKANAEGLALVEKLQKEQFAPDSKGNQAMKDMTGKSTQELMNMSDAELEAFANEMEQKFGKQ